METPTQDREKNLNAALLYEIDRNAKLLEALKRCGPSGAYCVHWLSGDLVDARNALAEQDAIAIVKTLVRLRSNKF